MSVDIWFTSDQHYGHANILNFKNNDGSLVRPGFTSVHEMDEFMIANHNRVVKPQDHVYFCGDTHYTKASEIAALMKRLNGKKRLILGNHDDIAKQHLLNYFEKIVLWRHFSQEGFIVTHIPLPYEQFRHKSKFNVHGHLHTHKVMMEMIGLEGEVEGMEEDLRYINICVENTDYTPIHMDQIKSIIKDRTELL